MIMLREVTWLPRLPRLFLNRISKQSSGYAIMVVDMRKLLFRFLECDELIFGRKFHHPLDGKFISQPWQDFTIQPFRVTRSSVLFSLPVHIRTVIYVFIFIYHKTELSHVKSTTLHIPNYTNNVHKRPYPPSSAA